MKILILALISSSAFAGMNDFECHFQGLNNTRVQVAVERSYGPGMKIINVQVIDDENIDRFDYYTTAQMNSMNIIDYYTAGMDLKIDLWPDRRPQYGRRYFAEFSSFDVDNGRRFYNIYCQYTGF